MVPEKERSKLNDNIRADIRVAEQAWNESERVLWTLVLSP